ncbi:alcohol dehydrogenase catalytic domain-containing protein [Arthrobacter bambusae]|uniref:alcohol dehydrogenase catalytic domain-containing protein n=1 Tax=Arthrobacter bambusae TaxID=1338426 RepID=UPI00277D8EC2|nr:alcohol dehydrogenase catalytic domain-containing protein [Arthrobacter bambusae]MDQ0242130.1 propanol-preferring alcohol dehydrogenase [Arthrobacter bambusae]
MRAVQLIEWGGSPLVRDVPKPKPTGEQLLIKVGAAGLCLSDLHVMDAPAGTFSYPLPLTLGHEVAGTVIAAGPGADNSWIDRSVVVHGIWACRRCRNCRRGRENYCLELRPQADGRMPVIGNGLGRPGGLAELMLVPSSDVLVDIKSLTATQAAPLADAGLTAYHAINSHRSLIDGSTVAVVVGVGGLGHLAIQILRHMRVGEIIAVDNRTTALDLARRIGASSAYSSIEEAEPAIARLGAADIIFDFAGAPATLGPATRMIAPGGRVVIVGSGGGRAVVGKDLGLANGWQVSAPFWGARADLEAVVDLAIAGVLHAESSSYPLESAPEVYRQLRAGSISGRAVIVPS